MPRLLLAFAGLICLPTRALEIRHGLSDGDRQEIVRILGFNTSEKTLSNPYPLGGYLGLEVGYSIEFVDVRELRHLGCVPASVPTADCPAYGDDRDWSYSRISVGKGLYNNVDIFISMMMPIGQAHISDYGGTLRWSFYQAEFLPINLSFLVMANQFNVADTFMDRNLGADLMAGVNVDNFAMYFGGGLVESTGTFTSCQASEFGDACAVDPSDTQVNGDTHTVSDRLRQTHTVIGFSLHLENLFAAAQVDRYADAVYSLKMGLRF